MAKKKKSSPYALTPLFTATPPKNPPREWVLDIEATRWVNFLVGGLYDGETFSTYRTVKEMLEVFRHQDYGFHRVWAHFGGVYDFMFLLQDLISMKNVEIGQLIPRGSGILCFDATFLKRGKDGCLSKTKVTFADSSALLPHSLAHLTAAFKVKHLKGSIDFDNLKKVTPELLKYLESDCRGLYEVLEAFREWPLIAQAGMKTTMASQALQVLRTFLVEPIMPLSNTDDAFVRGSYFGGRTEIFKPVFSREYSEKKLSCFDVNSLYPTVMLQNEFPGAVDPTASTRHYRGDRMGFWDAEVEVPRDMYIPPLPVMLPINGSQKLVFPVGRFSGRWSTIELEYAKSLGVKVLSTGRGLTFKSAGFIFKDFIERLWSIRQNSEKNSVHNILAKLLMNSCYGRFGLIKDREEIVFDDGSPGLEEIQELTTEDGQVIRLMKRPKTLKAFTNVAIAAWVTSLARIHMHRLYLAAGPEHLWYTDTDSVFTTFSYPNGDGLGELKFEYDSESACFLLPKTYVTEGEGRAPKVVMKGFDKKKINHFRSKDFFAALEGDMRILKAEIPEKFARMKTALRQGKFVTLMPPSFKQIRSQYDKRTFFQNSSGRWDSRPLRFENGVLVQEAPLGNA